ncbi:hypothetical protein GOP47_0000095 [Adiantum capillus-veneris]|uniref:Uncharacterized protein n=1 Tax=Adiantum capillus-veneris TaxID=13818 RepID=A0A9D4VCD9_ADICA|nr:hypothetical protein GOP47_0000095 [Adiantum capillus-veneris]
MDPAGEMDARLSASMVAINTLTLQVEHLFKAAIEGSLGAKIKEEMEELVQRKKYVGEQRARLEEKLKVYR